jgi:hypothetical protein
MIFPIHFSNTLAFRAKAEAIHFSALRALDRLVASLLAMKASTISGSRGGILPAPPRQRRRRHCEKR